MGLFEELGTDFYPDTEFSEAVRQRIIELTGKDPGFIKIGHATLAPGFDPIKGRQELIEQMAQSLSEPREGDGKAVRSKKPPIDVKEFVKSLDIPSE